MNLMLPTSMMNTANEAGKLQTLALWLIVASSVSISLPTPLLSLTTGLFLVAWLLIGLTGRNFGELFQKIWVNPVAKVSLLLWLAIALGMSWSSTTWQEAWNGFGKYRELLLLPLMASLLTEGWGKRVFYGFLAGHIIGMLLSYLQWMGYAPLSKGVMPSGFHSHIPFATFEAFLIYACLFLGFHDKARRNLFFLLSIAMLFNLLFINTGRTGFLVLALLALTFMITQWKVKGFIAYLVIATLAFGLLYQYSPTFKKRLIQETTQEIELADVNSNMGTYHLRPTLWKNALLIIQENPLTGFGTGSFLHEYQRISGAESKNPHQQFLLTWVELGIGGLFLLCYLLYTQWKTSRHLPAPNQYIAYGFLIAFILHSFLNSSIMDNVEGHFYALMSVALWADDKSWTST